MASPVGLPFSSSSFTSNVVPFTTDPSPFIHVACSFGPVIFPSSSHSSQSIAASPLMTSSVSPPSFSFTSAHTVFTPSPEKRLSTIANTIKSALSFFFIRSINKEFRHDLSSFYFVVLLYQKEDIAWCARMPTFAFLTLILIRPKEASCYLFKTL